MSEYVPDSSLDNLAPSQEVAQTITSLHSGLLQAALLPMEVPGVETLRTESTAIWKLRIADFQMHLSKGDIFNTSFDISSLRGKRFNATMAHGGNAARFAVEPTEDGGLLLRHRDEDIPCALQPAEAERGKQLLQAFLDGTAPDELTQNTQHTIRFRDLETGSTISCRDEISVKNSLAPTVMGVLEISPNIAGPFELRAKLIPNSPLEYHYSKRQDQDKSIPKNMLTIGRLDEVRKFGAGLLRQLRTYNEAHSQHFKR